MNAFSAAPQQLIVRVTCAVVVLAAVHGIAAEANKTLVERWFQALTPKHTRNE